ncbi:hypothetical protein P4639_14375 [Priestia megaterium]|uniref:hypothetical protein n=1 Tax=Priestia megaterium TaxID=1404 RepID=UPI002E1BEB2C|nr:hypothetical protein [Priestia megaterium]
MDKLQAIKDVIHRIKYDPDFEDYKGILEDLQIDWLIGQYYEYQRFIQVNKEANHNTVEMIKRLNIELAALEEAEPKVLKAKGGKPTKIAYNGSEYIRLHPTTAKGVR